MSSRVSSSTGYSSDELDSETESETQPDFKCNVCLKVFNSIEKLNKHEKNHEKNFFCLVCSKGFSSETNLNRHTLMQHGRKKFICHACKQCFLLSATYAKHVKKHVSEKPVTDPSKQMDVGETCFKDIHNGGGTLMIKRTEKNVFVLNVIGKK